MHLEDFKVVTISCLSIMLSYLPAPVQILQEDILSTSISTIDFSRYSLIGLTFLYTARKWWLMESKNKKDKK